jgi:hypothetical protein
MKKWHPVVWAGLCVCLVAACARGEDGRILIDARGPGRPVSPYLTGACIEDVNHEVYGGIYSQMLFGESFQEPPPAPLGFTSTGGQWRPREGELWAEPSTGPMLLADGPNFTDGEAGVEVFLPRDYGSNAGLVLRADRPGKGEGTFAGYAISLDTSSHVELARHRRTWETIRRAPCPVPAERWVALVVRRNGDSLEVLVDGRSVLTFRHKEPPGAVRVGLRTLYRPARFRNLWVKTGKAVRPLPFVQVKNGVSAMWRPVTRGSARGEFGLTSRDAFAGRQSQRITFRGGKGEVGIDNRGLGRWGLNLVAGKPYEGYVWVRAARPTPLVLALESADGGRVLDEVRVEVRGGGWARYDFTLTPRTADRAGRFAIKLTRPGSVVVSHAFLQPGPWGRFKGLPVRRDIAEALVGQGLTVLRYGGSMVNHPAYRWKKMIGPRDRRPPGPGWWYSYSSNGWGIFDFLAFCEAAGLLGIPAVNMGETPEDLAALVEYANGPADSPWGKKRAADGHPRPYNLRHLELGNEEAVNDAYWKKFKPMAEAIWAKDPKIILVVGDFAYHRVITDPYHFQGGVAVNTLAAHRKILELARAHGREVWFDIHIDTDHPPQPHGLVAERSYAGQLGKIAPGAKYKVVFFEYNSGNHAQRRALSNALATNAAERFGGLLAVACSANCLQPDGHNDNGWDQGLLFFNPSKVWLQPPGYVTQMTRRHYQPLLVETTLRGSARGLSVNALRSRDGKTLVVQVVNADGARRPARIEVRGITPAKASAAVEELAGPPDAVNTADAPDRITPKRFTWRHALKGGAARYTFPPHSFTVLRFE